MYLLIDFCEQEKILEIGIQIKLSVLRKYARKSSELLLTYYLYKLQINNINAQASNKAVLLVFS